MVQGAQCIRWIETKQNIHLGDVIAWYYNVALPKFNMEPKSDFFGQKDSPIPRVPFSGSIFNFGRLKGVRTNGQGHLSTCKNRLIDSNL